MEGLAPEVAPFGIRTMLVEPGFFRTELLTPQSTQYAEPSIEDYADRTSATVEAWKGMDGKQGGDPAKLADALVQLAALDEPPVRFAAGADAVDALRDQGPRPCSPRPTPTASCPPASPTTTPDPGHAFAPRAPSTSCWWPRDTRYPAPDLPPIVCGTVEIWLGDRRAVRWRSSRCRPRRVTDERRSHRRRRRPRRGRPRRGERRFRRLRRRPAARPLLRTRSGPGPGGRRRTLRRRGGSPVPGTSPGVS